VGDEISGENSATGEMRNILDGKGEGAKSLGRSKLTGENNISIGS
jgi:ethanolamine utilization protein EutA (predicted chaperonin)